MAVTDAVKRIDVTEVLDAPRAGNDLVVTPHPLTTTGQVVLRGVMLARGDTLASLLARHGVDAQQAGWVVTVGGMEVPAALWARTRAKPGMLIEAHRVAGKSVVRLVALVALAYFTMGLAAPAVGMSGGLAGTAWMGVGFPAYALNVGAFMLGSMVINKLLPPPGVGSYGGSNPGTTYSLQGARNRPRQFEPLGLLMGQVRVAPDFAAQPFAWFEGDDQYQYIQLHGGLNVHTVDELKIGQTDLATYSGVTVTRTGFASGNTPMLAWESVDTVAGGLLDAVTAPGAWVERNSSPNTLQLQVDIVGQLQSINSNGNPTRAVCDVEMEYRLLPSGPWYPFLGAGSSTVQLSNSTTKPLRRTITHTLPAGQYAVRMRKLTANSTSTQAANTIEWATLKSYQADGTATVARQIVGIKIKASGQLNGVLDQVTWLATSTPCPVWDGSAWVTQTTSNPGALFLQFCRGHFAPDGRLLWGIGKPDDQIDIEGLKGWMVHCAAQGYRFDHWWDAAVSRADVLDAIAAAGLAARSHHTGKLGVVYMASGQAIEAVVGMGNIKRGSMRVGYATRVTAEELEVASPERTNGWLPATLRVLAPGVTVPRETARMSPPGITTQAGRLLAARMAMAQNIYGRMSVTWDMDLEHLTFRRWSLVALSHDLTQWGHSGRLQAAVNAGGTITLHLDAEVPAGGAMHVGLRLPGEQAYRVFSVATFTGAAHTLTLAEAWPAGVALPGSTADNPAMDTLWIFDFNSTPGRRLRVADIRPTANLTGATITAVPEPDDFWGYMASGAYTVPATAAAAAPVVLSNLQVTQQRLTLSYDLTAELDITFAATGPYDHAQVWGGVDDDPLQLLGTTRTTRFAGWRVVNAGEVTVRVQAFDGLGRPGAVLTGTHDVVLDAPLVLQGNRLPVGELLPGLSVTLSAPIVGHWHHNSSFSGSAAPTSELRMDVGPDGQPAVIWRSTSGTGGEAQGGWNRLPADAVDRTRAYRFAVWVRCSGNTSGQLYMGCRNVETLAGVPDANPYFFYLARSGLMFGRWYLAVGYVHAAGASVAGGQSGLWDAVTGEKVLSGVDYRWAADALDCRWRTYQYYTTAAGAVTDWAAPMVHELDGTEPSIAALLAMSARGRVAWLTASSQVFAVATGGSATPASITFTALAQNLEGAPGFSVTAGTATLAGSGTTRTLAYADMAGDSATITMTWAGISDSITVVKVREGAAGAAGAPGANGAPGADGTAGADAVVGLLTNESHVVSTRSDGLFGSFAAAGGTFKVFDGLTDRTGAASVTYSISSTSFGLAISIASTGVYTVTGLIPNSGTATLRAVYGGRTIDKVYSIAKSMAGVAGESTEVQYSVDGSTWHGTFTTGDLYMRQRVGTGAWSAAIRIVGEDGTPGDDGTYVDYVFKRSSTGPATPTGTGVPAGWAGDPPAPDGNALYMSKATKAATGALVGAWSTPVRLEGADGAPGTSSAQLMVYQRAASAPALPSATVTYTFSGGGLSGLNNGWTGTIPAGTEALWMTKTSAIGTGSTATVGASDWSAAVLISPSTTGVRADLPALSAYSDGGTTVSDYSRAMVMVRRNGELGTNSPGNNYDTTYGDGYYAKGSWFSPTTAGVGDAYFVKASKVSGAANILSITQSARDVWLPLTSDRFWQFGNSSATAAAEFLLIQIATDSLGNNVVTSFTADLTALTD